MTADSVPELLPITMLTPLGLPDATLTGDEIATLPRHKRRPDYLERVLTSRIASYEATRLVGKNKIHNFGTELKDAGHHLRISNNYALAGRLPPALMLLWSTPQRPLDTCIVLRLDNLFEQAHKHHYLSVKSGDLDEERVDEIYRGLSHLQLLLRDDHHALMFFEYQKSEFDAMLKSSLDAKNIDVIYRKMPIPREQVRDAANNAYAQLQGIPGLLDGPRPV